MPQGNDTAAHEAFKSSVESQYGPYSNVEQLIQAHAATIDPSLRRAGLTQIDPDATAKLREEGLAEVESQFEDVPEDHELVDFAVRGNALVGVFVDPAGNYSKMVTGANDRYKEPAEKTDTALLRAQAKADARVRAETARLQADADAQIAEARAEADARISEEVAKIREEADADVVAAQEEASSEADSGGGKKPAARRSSKSGDGSK